MAGADYKRCDLCGGKAFYDANLSYENSKDNSQAFREVGVEQYDTPKKVADWGVSLGYVGDWAVLCTTCAKTYKTAIVPIPTTPTGEPGHE